MIEKDFVLDDSKVFIHPYDEPEQGIMCDLERMKKNYGIAKKDNKLPHHLKEQILLGFENNLTAERWVKKVAVCRAVQEIKQKFCKRFWYPECRDVEFVCSTKAGEYKIVDDTELKQCPACDAIDSIFKCCVKNKEEKENV